MTVKDLIPFKPGQSGNPNGRPKKVLTLLKERLIAEGIDAASPSEIRETYSMLVNARQENLVKIANDPQEPMGIRVAAKQILSAKGWDAIKDVLDRAHGKPLQKEEVKFTGTIDDMRNKTDEELDAIINSK